MPNGHFDAPPPGSPGAQVAPSLVVGVLSDTHGHLYPRVARLLEGVVHIIHAGDVGSAEVLKALRSIAPVVAVRGNCDLGSWADALPVRAEVELAGVSIVVGHMALRPPAESGQPIVVVSGHSHVASVERRDEVVYVNPGSAGPRRFGRPRTIVQLEIWAPAPGGAEGSPRVAARVLSAED
jgi:putative phosphoesterase